MKVAIVHDWLNQKVGGAENVLFELAKLYPKADIYTLVYNPKKFDQYLSGRKVITSRLQAYPAVMRNRPKLLLPFIQKAINGWDFSDYDLVISSSTAWAKNINVPSGVKHICYCHSPARMLWDSWPKYLDQFKLGPIRRYYITKLTSKLRLWDYYKSQDNIKFIANSEFVSQRIKKFYHQPSRVIYPPVEVDELAQKKVTSKKDYYLVLSVLAQYKNIELAMRAFMLSGKQLVVAGDGPELARLRDMATGSDNIQFLGRVTKQQKKRLLQRARGFVFCSIEDFGITMVESIAAGTPVIALRGGGASEIIHENKSGVFYDQPTETALNKALDQSEKLFGANYKMPNQYIFERFSAKTFHRQITQEVSK